MKSQWQESSRKSRKMEERFSSAVLTLECVDCGNRMKRTMHQIRISPELMCLTCDSVLGVSSEQLRMVVAMLERRLA